MQRQHLGRPDTVVIPAGWAAGHRPVAEKTMNATATLRVPGGTDVWSDADDEMVLTPHAAYYEGPARVQALATQAGRTIVADDPETVASYLITVPADTTVEENHLVTVSETGDPALDGKTLQVRQVIRGSLRFERDLICTFAD